MKKLSEQEAYAAMFAFIEHQYTMTKSDDLGALLGSMSLLPDGATVDPAIWDDWCKAIEKATTGDRGPNLELR